ADLYAPFRPLATRIVSFVLIVWVLGGAVAFVLLIRGLDRPPLSYQVGGVALALLISAFLYLMASVRAVPSAEGLRVRDIVRGAGLGAAGPRGRARVPGDGHPTRGRRSRPGCLTPAGHAGRPARAGRHGRRRQQQLGTERGRRPGCGPSCSAAPGSRPGPGPGRWWAPAPAGARRPGRAPAPQHRGGGPAPSPGRPGRRPAPGRRRPPCRAPPARSW